MNTPMPLSERPTADLVLLILTIVVALSLLFTGAGIFVLALFDPGVDLSAALGALGSALTLLIGTVIGYLAGRGRSPTSRELP